MSEQVRPINLDEDLNASSKRLEELRAGRDLSDIPTTDKYWKALNKHRIAHGGKK